MSHLFAETIPWDQLPDVPADDAFHHEWRTYRRELPRLLEEGKEGHCVLIKGTELVGVYPTMDDAYADGLRRFGLAKIFVHTIARHEPIIRLRSTPLQLPA